MAGELSAHTYPMPWCLANVLVAPMSVVASHAIVQEPDRSHAGSGNAVKSYQHGIRPQHNRLSHLQQRWAAALLFVKAEMGEGHC